MQSSLWTVWETAAKIGTPLALAAFALAAGLFVAQSYFAKQRREIESATPEHRVQMLATLEDAFDVDAKSLPDSQRFELAKTILRSREHRFQTSARIAAFMATLLACVVFVAMLEHQNPQAPGPRAPSGARSQQPPSGPVVGEPTLGADPHENQVPQPGPSPELGSAPGAGAPTKREGTVRQTQTSGRQTGLVNKTRVAGSIHAEGDAQQNLGVVRAQSAAQVENVTQVGGDVTATGHAVQSVGVVEH